jgi:hypothetical protein
MMQGLIVELFFLIDGIDKLYNTLQRGIKWVWKLIESNELKKNRNIVLFVLSNLYFKMGFYVFVLNIKFFYKEAHWFFLPWPMKILKFWKMSLY